MSKATKLHEMLADFHKCAAEQHGKCAESMEKGAGRDFHENMAAIHSTQSEAHQAECGETEKVADGPMVSKVAPTIPPGVRPVMRPGQAMNKAADSVPMEFQRFVSLTSEE